MHMSEKFHHEYLNILFRSASHISTIIRDNVESGEPPSFPSKPVILPGCFTAAQLRIPVKYVKKKEDVVKEREKNEFLDDSFTDRLVVVLAYKDESLPNRLFVDKLKQAWNATEVIVSSYYGFYHGEVVSGSEFQSVLIIICYDCEHISTQTFITIVSRAQCEAGIIIEENPTGCNKIKTKVLSFLSPQKDNPVVLFNEMITNQNPTETRWLKLDNSDSLNKWYWWKSRMEGMMKSENNTFCSQLRKLPVQVRLQFTLAFPHLFGSPSQCATTGSSSVDENCIVSVEEVNKLDNETVAELYLLECSVLSLSTDSLSYCIGLLRKRNLLSHELNHEPIIEHLVRWFMRDYIRPKHYDVVKMLLDCSELEKDTLIRRDLNKNLFEMVLDYNDSSLFFRAFFSSDARCDWFFMDYLGFESGESEERRIEKYDMSCREKLDEKNILFSVIDMRSVCALELCVRVLKRYNHILNHELNSINFMGMTVLQYAVPSYTFVRENREEEYVVGDIKLLIEAGFPNTLLLHENLHRDNVLDTAISWEYWKVCEHLLSDEERREIFLSSDKKDKYLFLSEKFENECFHRRILT